MNENDTINQRATKKCEIVTKDEYSIVSSAYLCRNNLKAIIVTNKIEKIRKERNATLLRVLIFLAKKPTENIKKQ